MSAAYKKYAFLVLGALMVLSQLAGAQLRISEPRENFVSHFKYQFVAGTAPAGSPITLYVNGVPADSGSVRPDGVFEFLGVETPEGPVTYKAEIRLAGGRVLSAERVMHRLGAPDSIAVAIPDETLPADGKSLVKIAVKVFDKWGVAIPDGYMVTLAADSMQCGGVDADLKTPGFQAKLENGIVAFAVRSPREAGPYAVTVSSNSISAASTIEFTTPVEPLMLVGSADGSVTNLSTSGDLSELKDEHLLDKGMHSDGRLAFYGRGSIWSGYLLTASYDNTRHQDRLFKEVDPDVLYSIYGDNSTIDYTAQSNNPFFVKIERNRSYAEYGDYNTGLTQSELARYDRTFNGFKTHLETKTQSADLFVTLTDRKVMQEEIRGQGISGYYFLGRSSIVVGTEKVRVETRDKLHNEVILSRIEKSRFGDYEIDYQQGTLFFKQPVPGIDATGNPVYIVVSYEAAAAGASDYSYVLGGQAEQEIVKGWRIGGTAVHDRSNNDFTLLGGNTKADFGGRLVVGGEFAHGYDKLNAGGNAWKVDVAASPVEKLQLKSYYRTVESGFMNQTMGAGGLSSESGSTKYGAGAAYTGLADTKIASEFYKSTQLVSNRRAVINSVTGSAEHAFGSTATLGAKVENISYESPDDTSASSMTQRSTIVGVKGTVRPFERLNIIGEYEHSISSSEKSQVKPSVGTIGAEYRVFDPVTISAGEKFYANGGSASVFGIGSDIGYGTTAQARYQIANAMSGERNQVSIGLKNVLHVTEDVTTNVSYERTRALDRNLVEARTQDNDAVSVGLEYVPKAPFKASLKGELAKNSQGIRRIAAFGGDVALVYGFSLIDKFSYYEEDRALPAAPASGTFAQGTLSPDQIGASVGAGLMKKLDNIAGLAFRPMDFDWLNAIGKYEKKIEFNGVVSPRTSSDVDIVSLHAFIEPVAGLGIGTKYAMKASKEEAFGLAARTMTNFYLVRAEYALIGDLDCAAEYRRLDSRIAGQANSASVNNGYSAELGYVVMRNIRVGAGYNFAGTKDRDLVSREYWSAGPFVGIRAKFTEKILSLFNW